MRTLSIVFVFVFVLTLSGIAQAESHFDHAHGGGRIAQAVATLTPAPPAGRPALPSIRLPLSLLSQQAVSGTQAITNSAAITATAPVTVTAAVTGAGLPPADAAVDPYAGVLEGTIVANRTVLPVRFFMEGQTYELAPQRSLGLDLPRDSAVLNLFNCAANHDSTDPACFWDPYLLQRDGFYEVIDGVTAGRTVDVALREAGDPAGNLIWVQNRTGAAESIVLGDAVVELAPSSVQEFAVETDGPVIVQLRECIEQGEQTVCEWTPRGVDAGYYYGLVRKETPGPDGTLLVRMELERVLAPATAAAAPFVTQGMCRLLVPTLNVRSGPGLEFPILTKVRGTPEEPASITVVGFDPSRAWMQVAPEVVEAGWVTANPDYITCGESVTQLPSIQPIVVVAPTPEPEPTPTPAPALVAAPVVEPAIAAAPVAEDVAAPAEPLAAAPVEEAVTTEEPAAQPASEPIPEGQARLIVNNGMGDVVVQFTMDQRFRVDTANPTGEWLLDAAQAPLTLYVYPGMVAFSASTPWQGGLGDNADFYINEGEERTLWLYFVPDPSGNGEWNLQF